MADSEKVGFFGGQTVDCSAEPKVTDWVRESAIYLKGRVFAPSVETAENEGGAIWTT